MRRKEAKIESPHDGPNFFFNPASGQVHMKVSDVVDFSPLAPVGEEMQQQQEAMYLESLAPPLDNLDRSCSNRTIQERMGEIMSAGMQKIALSSSRKTVSTAAPVVAVQSLQQQQHQSPAMNLAAHNQTMNALSDSIKVCQQSIKMSLDAQTKLAKGLQSLELDKQHHHQPMMRAPVRKGEDECWNEEEYRPKPMSRSFRSHKDDSYIVPKAKSYNGLPPRKMSLGMEDEDWSGPAPFSTKSVWDDDDDISKVTHTSFMKKAARPLPTEQEFRASRDIFGSRSTTTARSKSSKFCSCPKPLMPKAATTSCKDGPYCACPENNSPFKMKSYKNSMAKTSCKDGPYCTCPENNSPFKMKSYNKSPASMATTSCKDGPFCTCPKPSIASRPSTLVNKTNYEDGDDLW